MTNVEYADEPSRLLGAIVGMRAQMLAQLSAGDHLVALQTGLTALTQIDQWIRASAVGPIPDDQNLPILIQRGSLAGDCLLAAIAYGEPKLLDRVADQLNRPYYDDYDLSFDYRTREISITNLGIFTCIHRRPTLDPSGNCMMKPPCD